MQKNGTTRTLHTVKDADGAVTSRVRRTVLPSGLRVVTEQMAGTRSASIGVWVAVGSRDETPALHGCSHFLEHLLFKGTPERTAMDISVALDAVGGEFNAFTTKEYTVFHARVLDEDLGTAVDVLGDMVTASTITAADVEAERDVILDEIAMHDDDPDDVVHNLFAHQAWGDTPLGRPIAGTDASITAMTRAQIQRFYRRHYRPDNMVVSVAGNIDHATVVRQVRQAFGRGGFLDSEADPTPSTQSERARKVNPGEARTIRPQEQVNLVLGVRGMTRTDPRRYTLGVLNTALGGGTSSRMFQEVRELRGLAYSVYSFASHHADAGVVGVSVGCLPGKYAAVLETVRNELAKVAAEGLTDEEVERGKGQLKGGLVLGLEDSGSRMSRIGKAELVHDELLTIDEVVARIEAVTAEDVATLARELFTQPELLAVVGPTKLLGGRVAERGVSRPLDLTGSRYAAVTTFVPRSCALLDHHAWRASLRRRRARLQRRQSPARDDPDDRGSLLLHDADPEAAAEEVLGGLLHDVGHQLGAGGLVEEVDRAPGDDALVEQGDLVVAGAHPEQVDVEREDLVEALDRDAERGEVDLAYDEPAGVDVLLVAALGAVHARLGSVDREQLAGLQLGADRLGAGAGAAADLEDLVGRLDVHEVDGPLDARRDGRGRHGPQPARRLFASQPPPHTDTHRPIRLTA